MTRPGAMIVERFRWLAILMIVANTSCGLQEGAAQPPDRAAESRRPANRLAKESSPYLLAHAHNPVDWYPWGPEALEKARREEKPIFLSIGYSSCYWCHVMERQVFENEEIARYMNENFVNIKVDREERPDLDEIYMLSLQVYQQLAGSGQGGGWPLSMFLTPDGQPIAGGTYFPPEDMPGRPGFPTVMKQIQTVWTNRREDVDRTAEIVSREVQRLSRPQLDLQPLQLDAALVRGAIDAVISRYDAEHGGFDFDPDAGDGPKFPVPSKITLIQTQVAVQPEQADRFAKMIDHTLERMAAGGIRDHLAGGFHRYSVDRYWLVPHFEKMLYDNAQLAEVYSVAYRRTNRQTYREIAEEILDFVRAELTDPRGGFYSALDAETDGVEGKYYVWSKAEVEKLLSPGDARIFTAAYGLERPSTFEHGYVLHHPQPLSGVAEQLGISQVELKARLKAMRSTLLKARQQRPPLLKDDKILTSWNGLMIRAFARAGYAFQRRDYIEAAEKGALFVLSTSRDQEGQLLRTARQGEGRLGAYLDDYAFLVSGLLALHQATGEDKWLSAARRLTDHQISQFWDRQGGGFFFTSHDHETLITRIKSAYDSVLPSGNSVSVQNLIQLSRLTADDRYGKHAVETLQTFARHLEATPGNLPNMALALQEYLYSRGTDTDVATQNLFSGGVSSPAGPGPKAQPDTQIAVADQGPLIVHLQPTADESRLHDKIKVRGFLSTDKLPAGGTCQIAIEIDILEGWHINANPARPDFVVPTQLTLASEQTIELKSVHYPPGHDFRIEGIDEPLSVYEGKVYLLGTLTVPATLSGETELKMQLRYQACNNQSCLRPMRMALSARLPVATLNAVQAANTKLFQSLKTK